MIPGLTMGNVATESMTDAEVINEIMVTLTKTIVELRKIDMKKNYGVSKGQGNSL